MPLSAGILVGLVAIVVGAALYIGTGQKKMAMAFIGVGAAVALVTVGVVVLAVNSGM